jgi:CRP/FNR family transcriptional regulator, cyclic AMP receptor protein
MDDMSVEIKALQAAPFCAGLSPEDIAGIVKVGQPVTFEPGQAMVEQGDAGDGM